MIAQIAVASAAYSIDKPYSYRIPEEMKILPGMRVTVPFGRGNHRTEGIVLSVGEGKDEKLKNVDQVLDETPLLGENQLRLAAFIRERYFCTFYDAARVMLPSGLWFKTKLSFTLSDDRSWKEKKLKKPTAQAVLQYLEEVGTEVTESVLSNRFGSEELSDAVSYLLRKKWIFSKGEYHRRAGDKKEKLVSLACTSEQVAEFLQRPTISPLQRSVLELMNSVNTAAIKDVTYYTGASTAVINRLERLGMLAFSEREVLRCREIQPAKLSGPLELNEEQSACYAGMRAQMAQERPGTALLFGVTGSGKTSVFIKLIENCLADGKSAILMVPEIALTPQLLGLMAAYFGEQVAILHSNLSNGERYDQWKRVKAGQAHVVIGTRSAVFAPAENLGLIILDEEQEHSYQSENSPRYSAKEIALWRGAKENALVVLGSATPSVESMHLAVQGVYKLYTMKNRFGGRALPDVEIIDMREEIKEGNDGTLSLSLREAICETRKAGSQTVLLLNRRGNSRALVCVDCRKTPECPRCSVSMTYHSANQRLMCHYCGFSQAAPQRCPHCGGPLKPLGVGTQRVEQELLDLYPDITIERMDTDTVSAANTHEQILSRFQNENKDVLLGTQMVAKGLNLPGVTLVGVLDGDLSLYGGGFRAGENTFNMLTQVVGRAGRGSSPGRALIQTLSPEHQIIRLAANQDYPGFYRLEIQLRRMLNLPPFGDQVMIVFTGQAENVVLRTGIKFRDSLMLCLRDPQYAGEKCTVLGPAPCPVPKINYNFRYRLTITCQLSRNFRQLLAYLLRETGKDKANRGVSAYIDLNGFE